MKVEQLMTRSVQACGPEDRLSDAARIMWESDCGCVPVVEKKDGSARVVGMLTDRDICMAAYTQGRPLQEIAVRSAMAREVRSCRATDSLGTAMAILERNQLHRLPIVDQNDNLLGVLSLADIAREAKREHGREANGVSDARIGEVLEAISAPGLPREVAVAA